MSQKEKSYTRRCWSMMRNRCNSSKNSRFAYYGGAGVTYEIAWDNFERFYLDMGPRPEGYDLKRRDPNLGYTKENCFWARPGERGRIRRKVFWVEVDGIRDTSRGWCHRLGKHPSAVYYHKKKTGSMQTAIEFLYQQAKREGRPLAERPT